MKTIYIVFLLSFFTTTAQFVTKMTLSDYEIKSKDVISMKESTSFFQNNDFGKVTSTIYNFDANGYVTKTPYYSDIVYNKDYSSFSYTYVIDGAKKKQFLTKTPFGTFASFTNEITKNKNGSLKSIFQKDEKDAKLDIRYAFSYDAKFTTVTPNVTFLATEKYTSNGLKVSEDRNVLGSYFFAYDPISKLEVLEIFIDYYTKTQLYAINFYDYDSFGNWIAKYSYESIPEYGNSKNKIFKLQTRQITYKNGTITGNDGITSMKKLVAISNYNALNIKKYDATNLPLFLEAKDFKKERKEQKSEEKTVQQNVSNKNATVENPSQPNQPDQPTAAITDSKCEGNCIDGWGKYTYNNGSYEGFWKNSKKEGYGSYSWNTSDLYVGNWSNNLKSGFGMNKFMNGNTLLGEYYNGKSIGIVLYLKKETNTISYYNYTSDGSSKEFFLKINNLTVGCIEGDCQNGYGNYKSANGDNFHGNFVNGNFKSGIYNFANGNSYMGNFDQNNKYSGYGNYNTAIGEINYFGYWKNGSYNGRGVLYVKNTEQVGEFSQNQLVKSFKL